MIYSKRKTAVMFTSDINESMIIPVTSCTVKLDTASTRLLSYFFASHMSYHDHTSSASHTSFPSLPLLSAVISLIFFFITDISSPSSSLLSHFSLMISGDFLAVNLSHV